MRIRNFWLDTFQWWFLYLSFCIWVVDSYAPRKVIDYCDYYRLLGINRPGCEERDMNEVTDSPFEISYPEYPLCQGMYHSCMAADSCESGTICTLSMDTKPCCTAPGSRCPSVTELGFRCSKRIPTNWCFSDDDCSYTRTDRQICCPTGCNYNVCVHEERNPQPIQMYYNLMKCVRVNPTSWCMSQDDCPSVNSLYPRRCCMTPCGYNACVMKIGGTWMIA